MSPLLLAVFFVIVGLVLLIWSADRFIFGASAIARNSGISPMIIGLTIVAMGSSAPEMLVSATAAWQGRLDTSVGNAIGSNITNILLVIGATALLKPIAVSSLTLRREFPLLLVCTFFGYALLADHELTRVEGIMLLGAFIGFIVLLVHWGRTAKADDPLIAEINAELPVAVSTLKAVFWIIAGLALLLASSQLLVHGAVTIARYAGMSDLVIGLTIIAIGTSLPELAASIIGILKGEDDLALGNIIGSNIFNITAVLGLGAVIGPGLLDVNAGSRDSYVMIAATLAMLIMSVRFSKVQRINRVEGALLLACFVGYMVLLFQ
ncbi:calcium/sodium antiporter [Arsukibacterium sp.]|uniref:calcium/sodium antiporter n=1 Tax=Arsukibacterium sp. TaxID=1977258 RepID=UPI002FDAB976